MMPGIRLDPRDVHDIRSRAKVLNDAYGAQAAAARSRIWQDDDVHSHIPIERFRDDSLFVWQREEPNAERRRLIAFAEHLALRDTHDLLSRCAEDGAFGARAIQVPGGRMISRDLLDSVAEIYALESRVGLLSKRQWRILDIGAGYGRLAHRMIEAGVSLESYLCLDGVPLSTEICRFYLAARRVPSVVRSVSLMEIDFDNPPRADLAVAIHSLSEMPIAAVSAWVALVARSGADYLAVVPNDPERIQSTEPDGRHESLERVIAASGFTLQSDAQVVEGRGAWFAPSDHKGVPDRLLLYQRS